MEELVTSLKSSYTGKRVLVTGHNGFKGSWLVALLNYLGAEVCGVSLEIEENSAFKLFHSSGTHKSIIHNILEFQGLKEILNSFNPDLVFHLAAQALVLDSYEKPRETFAVNVQGTANLLESVTSSSCKGVIITTTDKVYRNRNIGNKFKESDELWGHDPYSLSKTGTELVIDAWRNLPSSEKCKLVAVRAGNVYGPGDRAINRLVPDLVSGMKTGSTVTLRNPDSVRPWQFVLDPLVGYLIAGTRILQAQSVSNSYNFGPPDSSFLSVRELTTLFSTIKPIDVNFSKGAGLFEAEVLKLDSTLAQQELGWRTSVSLHLGLELLIQYEKEPLVASSVENLIADFFLRILEQNV